MSRAAMVVIRPYHALATNIDNAKSASNRMLYEDDSEDWKEEGAHNVGFCHDVG